MRKKRANGKTDLSYSMAKLLVRGTPIPRMREESKRLLGDKMKGKTLAFVVDDKDLSLERFPLIQGVFFAVDASRDSTVMSYSYFFTHDETNADVLILRSSRAVTNDGNLRASLENFKKRNPDAVVIACAYVEEVTNALLPLVEDGLIHKIEHRPENDFELLRTAGEVLERLEQG